jgi:hypothetical protein
MTRLRRVAVVLAALAVVGTTIPTGGLSSASAERSVSVDVVPDDEAFLGIDKHDQTVYGSSDDQNSQFEEQVTLLTVTNRFPSDLTTVSATVTGSLIESESVETPDRLDIGAHGSVTATVDCDGDGQTAVTVDIVASNSVVTVELTRHVTIECEMPDQ